MKHVGCGGVNSARMQDSSVGGVAVVICLGAMSTWKECRSGYKWEVGRGEVGDRETHGEGQNEETTRNRRSINRSPWMA